MSPSPVILVVDDDPFMREVSRIHLERAGFVVALAADGMDGVAKARSLRPSAVVMDYAMPGLCGTDALKQIRADGTNALTPVLILTAWSSEASRREAEGLGATWLEKPVVGDALIEAIQRLTTQ